jgi:hypothetical protein
MTELTSLPPCPIRACSKCPRSIDDPAVQWVSADYGCSGCAPEMEDVVNRISGLVSRVELLEGAIRCIEKKTYATGSVSSGSIRSILRDHHLQGLVPAE